MAGLGNSVFNKRCPVETNSTHQPDLRNNMTHRTTALWALVIFAFAWFQTPNASAGVIANGDFSTLETDPGVPGPFEEWSTNTDSGFIAPVDGGGFASFSVTGFSDPLVHLKQTFSLPSDMTTLSFEFQFTSASGGFLDLDFGANDSFQASLFDSLGDPLFSIDPYLDAFYAFDASGFEDTASGVSVENLAGGWKRVTLDVASLAPQDYTVDFLLLGDDDALQTTVALGNVVVGQASQVIPEPTSVALWTIVATVAFPLSRRRRQKRQAAV